MTPTGYLIYSAEGCMCVALGDPDRPRVAAAILRSATIEERAAVAAEFAAYAGRYSVVDDRVIHHVEVSLFPNWIGTDLERQAELSGNRLLLKAALRLADGQPQLSSLVWERAGLTS